MTTAGRVLDVARSQLGTVAGPGQRTKYGQAYGMDGVAWCAMFAWWVFREAGASHLIPKTAWTPSFAAWFSQRGQADRNPRPGDLVFYDWPDGVHRVQHVGIVEAVNRNGTIQTIEGNTTSGAAGNQSNGGGVWRRTRSTSAVVLFGHPRFDGAAPAPAPAPSQDGSHLPSLTYGLRNDPRVASLQRFLNAYGWRPALPLLPATGNYLDQTRGVVRAAQAQMGVTGPDADGAVVGPRTNRALWSRGWRG